MERPPTYRDGLAKHYGLRAIAEMKMGRANNAFEFSRVAFHHAIEAEKHGRVHNQKAIPKDQRLPRKKAEDAVRPEALVTMPIGSCYCNVA